jgi:hypothetical protein
MVQLQRGTIKHFLNRTDGREFTYRVQKKTE